MRDDGGRSKLDNAGLEFTTVTVMPAGTPAEPGGTKRNRLGSPKTVPKGPGH